MRHYYEPGIPRNRIQLTLYAATLERLGHIVRVVRREKSPHWVDRYLPKDCKMESTDTDLYISTEDTWMRTPETPQSHADAGRRVAVIGCHGKTDIAKKNKHAIHAMLSHGVSQSSNVIQTVWWPFIEIIRLLDRENLIADYLVDHLDSIRRVFVPQSVSDVRGWYGGERSVHGRESKAEQLGNNVETKWSPSGRSTPTHKWLSWSLACRAGLDLPGVTWRTSRFTTYILFGIPVVCCPSDTHRVGEPFADLVPPVTRSNIIWLDHWGDTASLNSGLDNSGLIVTEADKSYREGWSPRGQMNSLVKRSFS